MTAVTCVDDRNAGTAGGYHGSAFLRMTHGADVGIAGDDTDGIRYAFSFGSRRGTGIREAQYLPAQIQHGGFEA